MYSMEDWRMEKLDILSTRGLGTFEDTMLAVRQHTGMPPQIADYRIAINDPETRLLMREGRTIGCFYVESPAMIQLLRKLRTDSFEMLTAASSIIRPGVAQSGMMQAFIERYHDPTKIDPPHPMMAKLLHSTFGVMVYQEDVIKVAHIIGGLRLGEADLLRRAMSGKMRSKEAMQALQDTFLSGCRGNGISETAAAEIWRQMESFAGYSFCKAHSASYAVLSFQEAWLKTHYPALFLCSVLNNQGGYYRPDVYVQEAKRLGIRVRLPDVQVSEELNACPDLKTIQLGFLHVKGLSGSAIDGILRARTAEGPFASLQECLTRTGLKHADALILVKCGAFDSLGASRPALAAALRLQFRPERQTAQEELPFECEDLTDDLRALRPYSSEQVTRSELEAFSFSVSAHVLDHYRNKTRGCVTSLDIRHHVGTRIHVAGWMVASKMSRTRTGARMMFINLDDGHGLIDIVLFPRCFNHYGHILHGAGPYRVTGRVVIEHSVVSVAADSVLALGAPDG
jgi:DNA polymerase III alpha subunit